MPVVPLEHMARPSFECAWPKIVGRNSGVSGEVFDQRITGKTIQVEPEHACAGQCNGIELRRAQAVRPCRPGKPRRKALVLERPRPERPQVIYDLSGRGHDACPVMG